MKCSEYCRAQELGIALPEATPAFNVGLLYEAEGIEPIELIIPKEFPLTPVKVLREIVLQQKPIWYNVVPMALKQD
ncbi:hypothetical protein ACFL6U_15620 [Planctomycetota bacterium]